MEDLPEVSRSLSSLAATQNRQHNDGADEVEDHGGDRHELAPVGAHQLAQVSRLSQSEEHDDQRW